MIKENPDRNGKWKASDAIAFGIIDGEMYIGYNPYIIDKYCKQSAILQKISNNFDKDPKKMSHFWISSFYAELYGEDFADNFCGVDRDQFEYPGRIWVNDNIISFWTYPSKKDLLTILLKLRKEIYEIYSIDIDIYNLRIDMDDHYVTIKEYQNGLERNPDELKKRHTDIYADKSDLKKNIKKINLPKGMTKAEYNSLVKTSENKQKNKTIIIDEKRIPLIKNYILNHNSIIDNLIGENFNLEIKPSEISLSSFKPQSELNPKIWINNLLNSRVRLRLLDIADDFIDFLDIDWVDPIDIIMTGSLTNYNWSKYSDIDLHIIFNFKDIDDNVELVRNYLNSKRSLWNDEHEDLKIYNFPIELYVQDINEPHISSGTYSLERNEWINHPDANNIKPIQLEKYIIKTKVADIINAIDNLADKITKEQDDHKLDLLSLKVKKLFDKIKRMRKISLEENGEFSIGNIIYKVCRRLGYIDKLYDLKIKTYDKLKSLT